MDGHLLSRKIRSIHGDRPRGLRFDLNRPIYSFDVNSQELLHLMCVAIAMYCMRLLPETLCL